MSDTQTTRLLVMDDGVYDVDGFLATIDDLGKRLEAIRETAASITVKIEAGEMDAETTLSLGVPALLVAVNSLAQIAQLQHGVINVLLLEAQGA